MSSMCQHRTKPDCCGSFRTTTVCGMGMGFVVENFVVLRTYSIPTENIPTLPHAFPLHPICNRARYRFWGGTPSDILPSSRTGQRNGLALKPFRTRSTACPHSAKRERGTDRERESKRVERGILKVRERNPREKGKWTLAGFSCYFCVPDLSGRLLPHPAPGTLRRR